MAQKVRFQIPHLYANPQRGLLSGMTFVNVDGQDTPKIYDVFQELDQMTDPDFAHLFNCEADMQRTCLGDNSTVDQYNSPPTELEKLQIKRLSTGPVVLRNLKSLQDQWIKRRQKVSADSTTTPGVATVKFYHNAVNDKATEFLKNLDDELVKQLQIAWPSYEKITNDSKGFFSRIVDAVLGWWKPKAPVPFVKLTEVCRKTIYQKIIAACLRKSTAEKSQFEAGFAQVLQYDTLRAVVALNDGEEKALLQQLGVSDSEFFYAYTFFSHFLLSEVLYSVPRPIAVGEDSFIFKNFDPSIPGFLSIFRVRK
jgi:hypothetical protein